MSNTESSNPASRDPKNDQCARATRIGSISRRTSAASAGPEAAQVWFSVPMPTTCRSRIERFRQDACTR